MLNLEIENNNSPSQWPTT